MLVHSYSPSDFWTGQTGRLNGYVMSHYPCFFQFFGMNFCTSPRDVVFLLICCLCSKWDFHLACLAILVPSLWFRKTMWGFCHYASFQVTASQLQIHALVFALRYWTGLCTRFSLQWTRCKVLSVEGAGGTLKEEDVLGSGTVEAFFLLLLHSFARAHVCGHIQWFPALEVTVTSPLMSSQLPTCKHIALPLYSMQTPLTPDHTLPLQWLDSALGLLLYTTSPDPHTAFSHTDLQSILFPTLDDGSSLIFSSIVFLPSSLSLMLTVLDSFISAAFSSTWLSLSVYFLPCDSAVAWLSPVLIPVLINLSSTQLL